MIDKQTWEKAIFFDMDGTLSEWSNAHIDEVMSDGYFKYRKPVMNMIEAAKLLIKKGFQVCITSKVISGTTAIPDKSEWLSSIIPEIRSEHRFFIPYENKDKNAIPIPEGVQPYHILIDDSTHYGLSGWKGVGVKVDNGINNSNRTWKGYMISNQSNPEIIADTIEAIYNAEWKKYLEEKR